MPMSRKVRIPSEVAGLHDLKPFEAAALSIPIVAAEDCRDFAMDSAAACPFCFAEDRLDLGLSLRRAIRVRVGLVVNVNDVKAKAALDWSDRLTLLSPKSCLSRTQQRSDPSGWGQSRPPLSLLPGVFRILLRQILEFGSSLELLQNVISLSLSSVDRRLVDLAVWARGRSTNKDMANGHRFRNPELVEVLLVIGFQIGLRDAGPSLGKVDKDVLDLSLFRYRVRELRLLLLVIGTKLGSDTVTCFSTSSIESTA